MKLKKKKCFLNSCLHPLIIIIMFCMNNWKQNVIIKIILKNIWKYKKFIENISKYHCFDKCFQKLFSSPPYS